MFLTNKKKTKTISHVPVYKLTLSNNRLCIMSIIFVDHSTNSITLHMLTLLIGVALATKIAYKRWRMEHTKVSSLTDV